MPVRTSEAEWKGSLKEGSGTLRVGDGAFEGRYSFPSRFQQGDGTNPEELIGAAHAACYSMALSAGLSQAGYTPTRVRTQAKVNLEKVADGFAITRIDLETDAEVPNIDEGEFQRQAQSAKENCPVSKALAGPEITLKATLR